MPLPWDQIKTLLLDIDGTLTDGTLLWLGDPFGFTQRYHVRDGEAILSAKSMGLQVIPLSRNKTACAKARMQHLGLELRWVGIENKKKSLAEIVSHYQLQLSEIAAMGDGRDDVPVFEAVGIGCAVADAHPEAIRYADYVSPNKGGWGVVEDVVNKIIDARHFSTCQK